MEGHRREMIIPAFENSNQQFKFLLKIILYLLFIQLASLTFLVLYAEINAPGLIPPTVTALIYGLTLIHYMLLILPCTAGYYSSIPDVKEKHTKK